MKPGLDSDDDVIDDDLQKTPLVQPESPLRDIESPSKGPSSTSVDMTTRFLVALTVCVVIAASISSTAGYYKDIDMDRDELVFFVGILTAANNHQRVSIVFCVDARVLCSTIFLATMTLSVECIPPSHPIPVFTARNHSRNVHSANAASIDIKKGNCSTGKLQTHACIGIVSM